jgi:nucleotide-binding universal stress UspA family protein
MYQKILVPLDGSELAECALPHVKQIVKGGGAGEVTILNIFKIDIAPAGVRGYAQYIDINEIRENFRNASRQYLSKVESRLGSEDIQVKTVSLEGARPADTIAEYARENGIELIIIATHGYTGFKKLMLGSVALEVLHESHIPVLLIRPEPCRA